MSNVTGYTRGNATDSDSPFVANEAPPGTERSADAALALAPLAPSATLAGFDMVWAVGVDTVNAQLALLQQLGALPDHVLVGSLEQSGLLIGGDGDDRAMLAAPTLSFDTGTPKTARLLLTLKSGNMSFYNGFGKKTSILKHSIAGWKLAFTVRLNLAPMALEDLADGRIQAAPAVLAQLSRFDPSHYRFQSLVLDFQNSDLINYDAAHSHLPTDNAFLAKHFAAFVGAWLRGLAGAANPFVLGYPVTRKAPPETLPAALQPTGANVSADDTLNFLLVSGERKIANEPRLYAAHAGIFDRKLLPDPAAGGKLIMARELFFQRYLKPLLLDPLQQRLNALPDYLHARKEHWAEKNIDEMVNEKSGTAATLSNGARAVFVPTASGWSYRDHVLLHWHEAGRNSRGRESEQDLQYNVAVLTQPDAAGVPRLTVELQGALMRYEWERVNQDLLPFRKNIYMGKGWARARLQWSVRLQFVAGADGRIGIVSSVRKAPPVTDSGVVGIYVVSDAFAHLMPMNKIAADWEGNGASLAALEAAVLAPLAAAAGAMFDGATGQVILAAGAGAVSSNMQLNADGDIEIDFAAVPGKEQPCPT